MAAIDTKSMTLNCTLKGGAKEVVVIALEPPLAGYDDVKPRLLEMKALAQEGLGMIKTPQLTTYSVPFKSYQSVALISLLVYLGWFPYHSTSPLFYPAQIITSSLGLRHNFFQSGLTVVTVIHAFESLYTWSLVRKHTSFGLGTAYVVSTMFFGYHVWTSLRKRIQAARIDSVMKVE